MWPPDSGCLVASKSREATRLFTASIPPPLPHTAPAFIEKGPILEDIPKSSLLIIDEVEASLHPKAQRRMVKALLWLSRTKQVQVVLTTHSPYVLAELPSESRILLMRGVDGVEVVQGASPEFCLSEIDEEEHPEVSVFCEDREAKTLIRELVASVDSTLLQRVELFPVGPADVVKTMGRLAHSSLLPFVSVAVLDGDEEDENCLSLPGHLAPERQVFQDLKDAGWPRLSERFGVGPATLIDILEDAMLNPNHHAWTTTVGDALRGSKSYVWEALASVWVDECLSPQLRDEFCQRLSDVLPE